MTDKVPAGRRLFRFALLADTHIEAWDGEGPEPRSNVRSRAAVAAINRRQPAFALHLGDVVHPVPALPAYDAAIATAKGILGGLETPLRFTAGNHDIGDKPLAWMPAKIVRADWAEGFHARFGSSWAAFSHDDCRFVLLNAPLLNSGTALEAEQRAWLEAELAAGAGRRLFMVTHYPPYLLAPDEPGHYDNLDEPARSWLVDLLERYGVEALFTAHVHNLFYDRIGGTEHYVLPSTSFVRRDYSELFRIGPGAEHEFGRNDEDKVGFFEVEVFERGHRVTFRRANDRHETLACPLGVDLRHPWCEVVELPFNPPTDALQRRRTRNDYPLWALWRLGVDRVRVPLDDALVPWTRERMRLLHQRGLRFTVFGYDVPRPDDLPQTLDALELVVDPDALEARLADIAALKPRYGMPVLFAPLTTSQGTLAGGTNLTHFVGHGFGRADLHLAQRMFAEGRVRAAFDGLCITLGFDEAPGPGVAAAADLARELDLRIHVTVSLMPATPDRSHLDDGEIARRVVEARDAALTHPDIRVFLDTFMDIDRGYYVRHGLVDRRANLRPAGAALLQGTG